MKLIVSRQRTVARLQEHSSAGKTARCESARIYRFYFQYFIRKRKP
jgi:hypothetical protein